MSTPSRVTSSAQSGFALILALLTLVLLTLLGLTLASTTTTEAQIAANYRYGRMALYNAEAGLQAARYVLGQLQVDRAVKDALPPARTVPPLSYARWTEGLAIPLTPEAGTADYYPHLPLVGPGCDTRGAVGYGRVLRRNATRYENVSEWGGQALQGAFTIWVRRPLIVFDNGEFEDEQEDDSVVVTVRGTAPWTNPAAATPSYVAVSIIEQTIKLPVAKPCGSSQYQSGRDQLGTNFDPCGKLQGWDVAPG